MVGSVSNSAQHARSIQAEEIMGLVLLYRLFVLEGNNTPETNRLEAVIEVFNGLEESISVRDLVSQNPEG